MTPQSTFIIVAGIREGQAGALRTLLASMNKTVGQADPDNDLVPFRRFDRLHVARFVILEAKTADEIERYGLSAYPWRPSLAFLGDCDGEAKSFLAELASHAGTGLMKVFSFCDDFSAQSSNLLDWMLQHNITPRANYINWLGRTVIQVREEAMLHQSLTTHLPVSYTHLTLPTTIKRCCGGGGGGGG